MRSYEVLSLHLEKCLADLGLQKPDKAVIEPPKDKKFGDLAANWALLLGKAAGENPRRLADTLARALRESSEHIARAEAAGPGFINVAFSPSFWQGVILEAEEAGDRFGASLIGKGQKAQVEFVSANPTGPLHIGHGRGAAVGDSLARILRFAGFEVETEYYINDAGRQMRTLGRSIFLRLLALAGKGGEDYPPDCYQGGYVTDIAGEMLAADPGLAALPEEEGIERCRVYGAEVIFAGIRKDLLDFNVRHEVWFSERGLLERGEVERTIDELRAGGFIYEEEGALWFRSGALGDDKDRVLKKSDGSLTYFASDVAYHADKYRRGFTSITDVWGADHHGYIGRMRAAVAALGYPAESFEVLLVQLVNLLRDGEQVAMSTRAGTFETLADVLKETGADAARFMFLSRRSDSKLDFDLSLVRQRSMDNPVYYVQYAHARIKAVLRRAAERGIGALPGEARVLALLELEEELDLMRMLDRFPQVAADAARASAPHFITAYLMELSGLLHRYYAGHQVLGAGCEDLVFARLRLLKAVGRCLANGLGLLGVTAPESM
ncbi:MAG: arginine--tRNA ligase [Desulfovibrio sp.]|jgi:arginyl-tRNA synthetase|nr:arginine--tRNA ligase [Desulfovibrio sp.]